MTVRPRRSVLYMPGSNARALEKAKTLPADCLILDLEDAVAPDAKARYQFVSARTGVPWWSSSSPPHALASSFDLHHIRNFFSLLPTQNPNHPPNCANNK